MGRAWTELEEEEEEVHDVTSWQGIGFRLPTLYNLYPGATSAAEFCGDDYLRSSSRLTSGEFYRGETCGSGSVRTSLELMLKVYCTPPALGLVMNFALLFVCRIWWYQQTLTA